MRTLLLIAIAFCAGLVACNQQEKSSLVSKVNPWIGTTFSTTPSVLKHQELANESKGQTFPATGMPYAMTNWTPQTQATETKCIPPYYYHDSTMQGFRGSHWMSGSCTQDYGSFTIMPLGEKLTIDPVTRASAFSHDKELSQPSYYRVYLEDYQVTVEMTGTLRAGILKITYDQPGEKYIIIEPNSDEGQGSVLVDATNSTISGSNPVHRIYQGWGQPAGFSGYFYAVFNQEVADFGSWKSNQMQEQSQKATGEGGNVGAYFKFDAKKNQSLIIKIGTSFTSIEEAQKNLSAEISGWDFEKVHEEAEKAWEAALSQVEVIGGTDDEQTIFYSALYHAKLLPRIFNDLSGTYPGFADDAGTYTTNGYNYYVDFTTWDSYRAVHPLMNLIDPDRSLDVIKSIINKAEQGGWLPIFPCWNHYTAGMIGDHLISVVGDAYIKGITDFDVERAYGFMRKNAFESPDNFADYEDGKGRRALQSYMQYGFIPLEDSVKEAFHKNEQVSRTLEYAYDDFVLGSIARKLGKQSDFEVLDDRAKNYQNVFDTVSGFVRGRFLDGSWIEPFDPYQRQSYITEGTPYQYTWYVPQDMAGLMRLMGGKDQFIDKLDTFFEKEEYWHGNEPSHHIAYLYAFAGEPWKTQNLIREIIKAEYSNAPGGISGNDDVGQMSAWLVFSMMGFYPVTPGMPVYIIGSPVFDETKIRVGAENYFTITTVNNSDQNRYIQSCQLNGKSLDRSFLYHDEVINGGQLIIEMGDQPNKSWGNKNLPPSMNDLNF